MLLAIVSTLIIGFFLLLLYFHCLAKQRQEHIITERQKRRKHYNKAPVFTTIMATKEEVCTGSFKKFECQVVAFPLPEISWYKDNVEITCNKRYKFAFQNGVCSCLIEDITARDQGLYKCEAVNSEGVAYTSAYLLVKDRSVVQSSDGEKTHEEIFCKNQLPKNSKSNLTFEESLTNKENEPPDRAFSNIDDIQRKMEEDMTFEGKMKADDITDHSKEVTPKEITEKTEDKVISNLPADGTEFDSNMAGAKGKQLMLHVAEEQVEPIRLVNEQMQPTDVRDQQRENGSKIKTEIESGENMKQDGNKNGAKNETHEDDQKYKIGNETRTEDEGKDKTKQEIKSLRNEEKQKQEIEEFENETENTQKRNVDEKAQTLIEKQSIKKDKKAQTNMKENENRSGDNLKKNAISTEKGNEESLGMITDENLQDDRTTQNDAKEDTNLENVSKSQGAKKKLIEKEGFKDDGVQNGQKDEPDKRIKDERKTIDENEGLEDENLNKETYRQLINDSKLNTNAKVLDDKQEDELRLTEKEPNNTTKKKKVPTATLH